MWLSPNQPLDSHHSTGHSNLLQKTIVPKPVTSSELGSAGWYPEDRSSWASSSSGLPAAKAGLQEDDRIVAHEWSVRCPRSKA